MDGALRVFGVEPLEAVGELGEVRVGGGRGFGPGAAAEDQVEADDGAGPDVDGAGIVVSCMKRGSLALKTWTVGYQGGWRSETYPSCRAPQGQCTVCCRRCPVPTA